MKKLLMAATLAVAMVSCKSPIPPVSTNDAVGRQIARVVARHDAYVQADAKLTPEDVAVCLGQSSLVVSIIGDGTVGVSSEVLGPVLMPVLDRHDGYVAADPLLDALTRDTYLASSSGLRRLVGLDLDTSMDDPIVPETVEPLAQK